MDGAKQKIIWGTKKQNKDRKERENIKVKVWACWAVIDGTVFLFSTRKHWKRMTDVVTLSSSAGQWSEDSCKSTCEHPKTACSGHAQKPPHVASLNSV